MDSDVFKQLIKKMCKIHDISQRKLRFETIENIVVISMKTFKRWRGLKLFSYFKSDLSSDCSARNKV